MLQPVHEESSFTVLPTQQLGPHVLEREEKPIHSDDSPVRPYGCLSSPKFQRLFKTYLLIIKFLVCIFKIHNASFIVLFISSLTLCIYVLLSQEKSQLSNDLMQLQLKHTNVEEVCRLCLYR